MARQWIQTQDLVPAAMRDQPLLTSVPKYFHRSVPCVVVHGDDILRRKLAEFECTVSYIGADVRGEINAATSRGFSAQVNACTSV